jgi:hypothetical protein
MAFSPNLVEERHLVLEPLRPDIVALYGLKRQALRPTRRTFERETTEAGK